VVREIVDGGGVDKPGSLSPALMQKISSPPTTINTAVVSPTIWTASCISVALKASCHESALCTSRPGSSILRQEGVELLIGGECVFRPDPGAAVTSMPSALKMALIN
jgi:hypothetical protein